MPIHADTSLAEALRADPGMTDRLVALLGPDNALSRLIAAGHLPAGRIHFSDAAAIAEVPVEKLLELAGESAQPEPEPAPPPAAPTAGNDWFAQAEQNCAVQIDVRPMLAEGRDPFTVVVKAAAAVEAGAFLILDAPFDPAPLRRVLANKGLMSVGRPVGPGHWRICFRRDGSTPDSEPQQPTLRKPGETWREGKAIHIEVRGMMPPGPLTAVLRLIESGETDEILVHHDRDPMLLYPELEERGWECVKKSTQGDEVRLLLRPVRE
ncbi:MAG TPA: DUF2249 domain-containing protein [Azospirillum sp.]|nr:DUF2249 domain-containing protein [Azospirillum sp.]